MKLYMQSVALFFLTFGLGASVVGREQSMYAAASHPASTAPHFTSTLNSPLR